MPESTSRRDQRRRSAAITPLACVLLAVALVIGGELYSLDRPSPTPVATRGCMSDGRRLSVPMVGNSYTASNDLPSMVAAILCKSGLATSLRVDVQGLGGTLADWAARGGARALAGYDLVVLQDQSQVPSFGEDNDAYLSTLDALGPLGHAAEVAKSRLVLFQTWGHRHGDEANPQVSPNYEAMQLRLDDGYDDYLATVREAGADADLAPVGDTWWSLYRDDRGLFDGLYDADGSHPSAEGTYLAALVLARVISGRPLPARPWSPWLPFGNARTLQSAARAAA